MSNLIVLNLLFFSSSNHSSFYINRMIYSNPCNPCFKTLLLILGERSIDFQEYFLGCIFCIFFITQYTVYSMKNMFPILFNRNSKCISFTLLYISDVLLIQVFAPALQPYTHIDDIVFILPYW